MENEIQSSPNIQSQPLVSPNPPTLPIRPQQSKVKFLVSVAVLLLLVSTGIWLNKNYFLAMFPRSIQNNTQSGKQTTNTHTAKKNEAPQLSVGEKTITVKPGQTNILLADGETKILFGNSGSSTAVPDVVFGNNYNLNDIHNINYLPIRKEVSFYSKGYFIGLNNLGCKTETRFTDVPEVWVTECSIKIATQKATAPVKQVTQFSKELNTRNPYNASVNNQADNLLIHVTMPRLSMQNFSTKLLSENVALQAGSMTSYSADTPWDIRIISGYGVETIRYTAQEVWNKESKELNIGTLTIKSTIKDLSCRVIYTGQDGEQTQRCEDIIVGFTFSQDTNNQMPIKLVSYTE